MKCLKLTLIALLTLGFCNAQDIATLKYGGGGDWYGNPTGLPNLIAFCNAQINTSISEKPNVVDTGSIDIFQYPFLHMTGHGNVYFSEEDADNLRNYLISGGFLHIDDNYGMNEFIRKELVKVFPNKELQELPANHPIFSIAYPFPKALLKIAISGSTSYFLCNPPNVSLKPEVHSSKIKIILFSSARSLTFSK